MFELNTELLFTWLSRFAVMIACMPVHEWAHAMAADRLGDPTPRNHGRLTLNPFAHLDLFGSVLLITAGFGWAKPVPVDPRYFKRRKLGMAITSAAGPFSNIVMATLLMTIYKVLHYAVAVKGSQPGWFPVVSNGIEVMMIVNLSLAVFNLLPVPPLDGSKLFGAVLPDRIYFGIMRYERYIMILLFVLIYLRVLSRPLNFLVRLLISGLNVVTYPVELLMGRILVG